MEKKKQQSSKRWLFYFIFIFEENIKKTIKRFKLCFTLLHHHRRWPLLALKGPLNLLGSVQGFVGRRETKKFLVRFVEFDRIFGDLNPRLGIHE